MKLTKEQLAVIDSKGDIKINAVAGSGKTTTVIAYASARPAGSKILYLAFNRSVKLEAARKFSERGLSNVVVETAHSLAYKRVVLRSNYAVRSNGYKTHEIAGLLGLKGTGQKHGQYILANHIGRLVACFCNSDKGRVQDIDYLSLVSDPKARAFVAVFYDDIVKQTRRLLQMMNEGKIEITHDFYLKKFQLSKPSLRFDYILFDEGQDASPAMLDVFFRQKAVKVIVGDTHQQIYGWRYAVNSLERAEYPTLHLSNSFRFGQDIADLAMGILQWKEHLDKEIPMQITGTGKPGKVRQKAIIARTNLGLLLKAIEHVTENRRLKRIYFEGNISSYTYADEGASLYDVLNLYNGNRNMIRDKLIGEMKGIEDLEEYIMATEDVQLSMMVEIVKEYGNEIPSIIRKIKARHLDHDDKEKAEFIFSTVHKCKGMEYDSVQIVEDFINEEKLERAVSDKEVTEVQLSKLNEEVNLLYVAVTRARQELHIPASLLPQDFSGSKQIKPLYKYSGEQQDPFLPWQPDHDREVVLEAQKGYSVETVRKSHKEAYRRWTEALDDELTVMYCEGKSVADMAKHFGRTKGAILSRISKLELEELYG